MSFATKHLKIVLWVLVKFLPHFECNQLMVRVEKELTVEAEKEELSES